MAVNKSPVYQQLQFFNLNKYEDKLGCEWLIKKILWNYILEEIIVLLRTEDNMYHEVFAALIISVRYPTSLRHWVVVTVENAAEQPQLSILLQGAEWGQTYLN